MSNISNQFPEQFIPTVAISAAISFPVAYIISQNLRYAAIVSAAAAIASTVHYLTTPIFRKFSKPHENDYELFETIRIVVIAVCAQIISGSPSIFRREAASINAIGVPILAGLFSYLVNKAAGCLGPKPNYNAMYWVV